MRAKLSIILFLFCSGCSNDSKNNNINTISYEKDYELQYQILNEEEHFLKDTSYQRISVFLNSDLLPLIIYKYYSSNRKLLIKSYKDVSLENLFIKNNNYIHYKETNELQKRVFVIDTINLNKKENIELDSLWTRARLSKTKNTCCESNYDFWIVYENRKLKSTSVFTDSLDFPLTNLMSYLLSIDVENVDTVDLKILKSKIK